MRIHGLGLAVLLLALAWIAPVHAQTSAVQASPAPARRWVEACETVDVETRARFDALDEAMESGAALTHIEAALEALRATPCFALAALDDDELALATAEAARVWWAEGGRAWAWQFLAFRGARNDAQIVLSPTPRSSLALEVAAADDPLRALLCPEADPSCGRETAGWSLRAERAFEDHARRERDRRSVRSLAESVDCAAQAREAAPEVRYATFRSCESSRRARRSALPVGRMRAPTRGWLVVRGRRGHYQFRDEVRAYDLATGAAYVVSSGSALALRSDGAVDGAVTDAARRSSAEVGRLSVEAVRELAWMLLLGDRVEEDHAESAVVRLPEGIELGGDANMGVGFGVGVSGWFSSAQTRLEWAWIDRGRALHHGSLTWPSSSGAVDDHAAQLLRIAEATFLQGCAPAALPVLPRQPLAGGVSALDAEPVALAQTEDVLFDRLLALRGPRCR